MELKNKVVLITGSTRGIGQAMALAFAKAGAKVIINGRHEQLSDEFKAILDSENAEYQYLSADLAQTDLKEFAKKAWDLYGRMVHSTPGKRVKTKWHKKGGKLAARAPMT